MKASRAEGTRWLRQAESDLAFAELGAREGFHAQSCFMAQQAAEKALKAVRYAHGERFVTGHSLVQLLAGIPDAAAELGRLRESAQLLDQFYIPARYPNGLPGGIPSEIFTAAQATDAVARARSFVEGARAVLSAL